MEKEIQYIVIHKASTVVSLLEDTFSFGGFLLVMWFNHRYLAGNVIIDILFIVLWISMVISVQSRRYHKFKTAQEAIKYLQEK